MADESRKRKELESEREQRCIADKKCPMTAGYYIGGGRYICWLHAFTVPGMMQAVKEQEIEALRGARHEQ